MLSSKQRLLKAIDCDIPDRLPATTHHIMSYFLDTYMNGASNLEFFERFGLDPIIWGVPLKPNEEKGEYYDPDIEYGEFTKPGRIISDHWRIESEEIPDLDYHTLRYKIITPRKTLTTVIQMNQYTGWAREPLIKDKSDIEIIAEFATTPLCNVTAVNKASDDVGDRCLVRGHINAFDIFGQPGCWQDAACLVGIERLIMSTYEDPDWVHEFLQMLQVRKMAFTKSLEGAKYDIVEFGGGDASTTVISPTIFDEYVAPYDSKIIDAAHEVKQRIVYHTCGGMMPILENIAAMGPDAMETFTPPAMGADVNLKEAKRRIGDKVCMIGGFDQFHFFAGCSPEDTRREVRRCFEEAGENGGFILCPSDHFFDADLNLIEAFADEAKQCVYE
jgi:uroporphyrinogen decarboxylase